MLFLEKPEPEGEERGRRTKRRWVLPPPPVLPAGEIEGIRILDELGPELGVLLFQRYRDALLWAGVEPRHGAELFGERVWNIAVPAWAREAAAAEVQAPLSLLTTLVEGSDGIRADALAGACGEIAAWAGQQGFNATEAAFAYAAAALVPDNPDYTFAAGRAARRQGRYSEAEDWFKRAIGLARRKDDEVAYAAAYLGWGVMEQQRGRREAAKARYVRAWKAAMRGKLRTLGAAARHYMISLAVPGGTFEEGQAHVVAAYKLYGRTDPRIPALANDAAALWAWHGYFSAALPLYEAALPFVERRAEQLAILVNIARAAAATGDSDRFFQIWNQITAPTAQPPGEFEPLVFIHMAEGARALGYTRQARELAQQGLEAARQRSDPEAEQRALNLLAAIEQGVPGDVNRLPPPSLRQFAARLLRRVKECAAARTGQRPSGGLNDLRNPPR